jgi:hypothetical protein
VANVVEEIQAQLVRLRATELDVGPEDAITVADRGHGNARLSGSSRRPFEWFGAGSEILERLSGLRDGAGPEAIRSEFSY